MSESDGKKAEERAAGDWPVTEEGVIEALRPVCDPEIALSVVDLGLVYGVSLDPEKRKVDLRMTLTSQMCPAGPEILAAAEMAVRRMPGVEDVDIEIVWSPPWDPRKHCSEEAKAILGIWD
ncbi:MAG: metal-sulfur cluster assembly factor [Candidatus Eisenbacteria bacterium]|nr:metal-sulfur cluster assembly factor [Candidatus Eisenbacteria bacterium]